MSVVLQILALGLILYAWRHRRSPEKRLVTGSALALAAGLGLLAVFVERKAEESASAATVQRTERIFQLHGQCIASECRKDFPGDKSILVVLPPVDDNNRMRLHCVEAGLRRVWGDAATLKLVSIANPAVTSSGKNLQWMDLKNILEAEKSAQTLILLCPLPVCDSPDAVSEGLRKLRAGRSAPLHIVGTWAYVDPLAPVLEQKDIDLLVLIGTRDVSAELPADDQAAISKRFIALRPSNLDEMNRKFPELNIYEREMAP
ncbi:MAG: hypothetical protein RL095_3044 [Verrucomicrobiota bacterium]|jgi:hypothetical protein